MSTTSRKAPVVKTAELVTTVRALLEAGVSEREVAKRTGVPRPTFKRWLSHLRDDSPAEAPADSDRIPIGGSATGLDALKLRLEQVKASIDKLVPKLDGGVHRAREFAQLVALEQKLAAEIAGLVPPPVPDPETDPTNVESAAKTVRMFAALVEEAEQDARCIHCGRHPFAES